MFSGFEIEAGKSCNAFLIAHIVGFCIIQSINQSWRVQFCRLSTSALQCMHTAYLKGNSRGYLCQILFGILLLCLKYEIRFASRLSTGYKAKLRTELKTLDFKKPLRRVLDHFCQTELSSMQLLIRKKAKSGRSLDLNA